MDHPSALDQHSAQKPHNKTLQGLNSSLLNGHADRQPRLLTIRSDSSLTYKMSIDPQSLLCMATNALSEFFTHWNKRGRLTKITCGQVQNKCIDINEIKNPSQ